MRRVADIAGRRDDDFRYGDAWSPRARSGYVLGTDPRIVGVPGPADPERCRRARGRLARHRAVAAALAPSLRPYGLPDAEIGVGVVDQIPRHASTGKLTRFVALGR